MVQVVALCPFSIYKKIGTLKLKPSNAHLKMADKSRMKARGLLEDCLVRVGELIVPVDFLVLDVVNQDDDDDEEPYLLLGRPFMDTTNMEISMRDETIKMTVRRKTLRAEITNGDSPPLYTAKFFPYYYDDTEIQHAIKGVKAAKSRALQPRERRKEEIKEKGGIPWDIMIP